MEKEQTWTVIEDTNLSEDKYNKRYIIIDKETGEILDNAQGYGYKSKQNAYKCYNYKLKHKKPKQHSKKTKQIVNNLINRHQPIFDQLSDILFHAAKENKEITDKQIKQFLTDNNIELPCAYNEFMRHFK